MLRKQSLFKHVVEQRARNESNPTLYRWLKVAAAEGLNDAEQITGLYADTANVVHGFVGHLGKLFLVDVPGSTDTRIRGNNSKGQIVGRFTDTGEVIHGFLGTPKCGTGP